MYTGLSLRLSLRMHEFCQSEGPCRFVFGASRFTAWLIWESESALNQNLRRGHSEVTEELLSTQVLAHLCVEVEWSQRYVRHAINHLLRLGPSGGFQKTKLGQEWRTPWLERLLHERLLMRRQLESATKFLYD